MTAQIGENIYYQGQKWSMCNQPLDHYFAFAGITPEFEVTMSALWRGYVGTWEIQDERLYLIGLQAIFEDGTKVQLSTFFPDFPERVFAHWYSGVIRIPQGKMLEYVHMGFGSVYEKDLLVDIEKGVVKEIKVRHNGTSDDPDAPEGYGIGATTVFLADRKNKENQS